MAKNKGLGMGLDALLKMNIQDEESTEQKVLAGFVEIPIAEIFPNPDQPRKEFNQEALDNLAQSIKNFGMIQPITVYKKDEGYEIIAGERRYRAAKQASLEVVPAIIKDLSQKERFEISIVENVQRENLNPVEEALAYSSLIETYQITHENLALRIGKSRTALTNSLRLLNLEPQVQKWLIEGKITPGHARTILSISDRKQHLSFANYIIQHNLSVREAEKLAKSWPPGEEKDKAEKKPIKREVEIVTAEEKLGERLQTKVKINGNSKNGKIQIDYFTTEELERLLEFFQINID